MGFNEEYELAYHNKHKQTSVYWHEWSDLYMLDNVVVTVPNPAYVYITSLYY